MRKLIGALCGCVLAVVMLEAVSFLVLGAIALRGGHASTYFKALLPHPVVSPRLKEVADSEEYYLMQREWDLGFGAQTYRKWFGWHPLLGHYGYFHQDGTPRRRPTFKPHELVVYLLGGSVVEAGGIATNLQRDLEAKLKDRYEVRVINEGVGGFMSTQELVLLTSKIVPFGNPHYVIAIDGYNDWLSTMINLLHDLKGKSGVTDVMWPKPELSWFHNWFDQWRDRAEIETVAGAFRKLAGVVSKRILVRTYTGWLLSHLRNWTYYALLKHDTRAYASWTEYEQTPLLPRERAKLQVINEKMMAEVSRVRGAQFFWVLQPALPCRGNAMTMEERQYYASRPAAFWQSLERYNQDVRGIVKEDTGYQASRFFLDLSCLPPYKDPLFIDVVHLSDAGQARVAESLAAVILTDLAKRSPFLKSGLTSTAK